MRTPPRIWMAACVASLIATSSQAASILFGRVGSTDYVADGQTLVDYLVAGGHSVTYIDLNEVVVTDFSPYDQVWVYDLVLGPNDSDNQMANYENIAEWFNDLTDQNLIADGRIVSSSELWTDTVTGTGSGGEAGWIQNYADQLEAVGGGMVLGTDHNDFQFGINEINALIGIDPFSGFFFEPPFEAFVDPLSPLSVPGLVVCTDDPAKNCINDNSSTGFAPTRFQPNGMFLTPVAYHGTISTAFDLAAVSATFRSPTFPAPAPPTLVLLGLGLAAVARSRRRRA